MFRCLLYKKRLFQGTSMTEKNIPDIYTLQYDFIDNGAGDLMMVIETAEKSPEKGVFYFDGIFQALFKRREDQLVALPHVTAPVRELLSSIEKIIIAEMDDDDEITEVYEVPVVIPENGVLPYPQEIMDLVDLPVFDEDKEEE